MIDIMPLTSFTLQPLPSLVDEYTEEVSTHTLPVEVTARVHKLASLTPQDISDLAWDLVLFNDMDRRKILSSYSLAEQDVADLQQLPLFMAETTNARAALKADPHLGVRRMAKAFLVQRVATLNELATSNMIEPAARLRAIQQLSEIAGLHKNQEEKGKGGVAVQINFGSGLPGAPQYEANVIQQD